MFDIIRQMVAIRQISGGTADQIAVGVNVLVF